MTWRIKRLSHDPKWMRGSARAASLMILLLALGEAVDAGDWSQWLGPTRNGASPETVKRWSNPPKILWKHAIGSGFSTPVVAEGRFFVHAPVPAHEAEEVLALDAKTGQLLWRAEYDRKAYKSALGAGPRATPTCDRGKIITLGITGTLSCYDAQSGKRLWQVNPYSDLKASLPNFGVCGSPIVAQGKVIVPVGGTGSSIVAYDAQTGALAWKGLDEPACSASPVLMHSHAGADNEDRTDVVVQTTLRIVGLNPANGSIRWEHPLVFQPSGASPTPLVDDDVLVCTTQGTGTLTLRVSRNESHAEPNMLWWQHDWTSYFSTGAVGKLGRVFLVTNVVMPLPRADVRCLDAVSGKEIWTKAGLGYFHVGVIATGDGKLLLLDDAGTLILADPAGGFKQLSRAKVCGGTFANPVLADGKLYARDNKEVVCVQLGP